MTRVDILRYAGQAAFGQDWQRAVARALGPLHPDGPRGHIDDRLVRRWIAGEREVPDWVPFALPVMLEKEALHMSDNAGRLRALAVEITPAARAALTPQKDA